MNRKGFALSLTQLVKITIVSILVIAFFAFGYMLYNSIFGGKPLDEKDNLNALTDQMDIMLQRNTQFEYAKTILIIKKPQYVFEGFSTSDSSKPELCPQKDKSCICLSEQSTSRKQISCISLNSDTEVVLLYLSKETTNSVRIDDYPSSIVLSPELFYRKFKIESVFPMEGEDVSKAFDMSRGALFYIEKYVSGSKTYLLVAPIAEVGFTNADVAKRIDSLSPCPDGSDSRCLDNLRNSKDGAGFCSFQNSKCVYEEISACVVGQKTESRCLCGESVAEPGKGCYQSAGGLGVFFIDCSKISSCADYCKAEDDHYECNVEETRYCSSNPCKNNIGSNCVKASQVFSEHLCTEDI